jgi:hypothetical protein
VHNAVQSYIKRVRLEYFLIQEGSLLLTKYIPEYGGYDGNARLAGRALKN